MLSSVCLPARPRMPVRWNMHRHPFGCVEVAACCEEHVVPAWYSGSRPYCFRKGTEEQWTKSVAQDVDAEYKGGKDGHLWSQSRPRCLE